jgi:hypothetical protein
MRYCLFGRTGDVAVPTTYAMGQAGKKRKAVDAGPTLGCGVPDDQCLTRQHALPPSPGQEPGDATTVARPVLAA